MKLAEYKENPYAWPGGYRLNALMDDGETFCHSCCTDTENPVHQDENVKDGWLFIEAYVHWEGPPVYCAHCGSELESEYGDPEEDIQ